MAENYSVICDCGYTTFVQGSDFGSSIECLNCGAELEVDESSATPGRPAEDAAPHDGDKDQGLPESPLVVHSPFAAQADTDPSSPFEDETGHGEIPAREDLQPPPPARARSPFEEDEQQDEETPRSGPFTLQPAPEAEDTSFQERIEAERPKESNRHVIIENESPLDKKTGEICTGCGREIRGDWDRSEIADGVLCYICSNQGTHGLPERVKSSHGSRDLSEQDLLIHREQPVEQPDPPWYMNTESDGFKRTLWGLAMSTLFFGVYIFLFDESQLPPAQIRTMSEMVEDIAQMPLWARGVLQAWSVLSVFLSGLIASYIALRWLEFLPHDAFVRDMLYIGAVILGLTCMHFLFVAVGTFLGQIPMFGSIINMLLPLARIMIAAYALSMFLDMRIKHLLLTFFLYFLLRRIVFAAAGAFVYRGLSAVT